MYQKKSDCEYRLQTSPLCNTQVGRLKNSDGLKTGIALAISKAKEVENGGRNAVKRRRQIRYYLNVGKNQQHRYNFGHQNIAVNGQQNG